MRRWTMAGTVLAVGALAFGSAVGPASAATTSTPKVEITAIGTARLVDHGAAIDVPLTVTCTVGTVYAVESTTEAFVTQAPRGRHRDFTEGEYYGQPPVCDGSPHVAMVRVFADWGGPWRIGVASVEAEADIHYQVVPGEWELASDEVTQQVKVRH